MNAYGIYGPMSGLPDPDLDRQFYAGVRVRRFVAWVADLVLVMLVGVPLAVAFGLLTLGFGFALFPLVLGGVGLDSRRMEDDRLGLVLRHLLLGVVARLGIPHLLLQRQLRLSAQRIAALGPPVRVDVENLHSAITAP